MMKTNKLCVDFSATRGCIGSGFLKTFHYNPSCMCAGTVCVVECFFDVNNMWEMCVFSTANNRHWGHARAGMNGASCGHRYSPLSTSSLALATSPFSAATCSSVHGMLLDVCVLTSLLHDPPRLFVSFPFLFFSTRVKSSIFDESRHQV